MKSEPLTTTTSSNTTITPNITSTSSKKPVQKPRSCISRLLNEPILNDTQREELLEMTKDLVNILERANLTYMMFSGTLLGSYRHHGIIPWDFDVDLQLDIEQQPQLENVFKNLSDAKYQYKLVKHNPPIHWKVNFPHKRFPFVDFFFYYHNITHFGENYGYGTIVHVNSDIFPLIRRPFSGMSLYAPRNTSKILQKRLGDIRWCQSPDWTCLVICLSLNPWRPFVFRNESFSYFIQNGSIKIERESLEINGTVLGVVDIEIPLISEVANVPVHTVTEITPTEIQKRRKENER